MTKKQKSYHRSLMLQMIKHRDFYLYMPKDLDEISLRKGLYKKRRKTITLFKDKTEHVASSLQHDLWT